MQFSLISIIILFLTYSRELLAYRAKKASPQALSRIKRLINQQIQIESEKSGGLLQSDAVALVRKDPRSKKHFDELSVNDPEMYFQGDVDLSEKQAQILSNELESLNDDTRLSTGESKIRKKRKIGREPLYVRWDRTQPISYDFEKSIPSETREKIKAAISLWEQNTCLRFRENGPNIDRLEFFNGGGCSSFVGKTGGTQGVSIATPGCDNVGIISHEIGHALGTFHEQARPDQYDNIYVNYHNIPIGRWNNFQPVSLAQADTFNLPYDAGSVMHYGPYGFATDPYIATIVTKDKSLQSTIGQREGPSFLDYQAINTAYRCTEHCPPLRCEHDGYPNPNNCLQCICPYGFVGNLCQLLQFTTCGALVKVTTKPTTISSPNYPDYFPQSSECVWLLKAPHNGKVFLEFTNEFHMSCEDTCNRAFVEVKAKKDFRLTGYRFCCPKIPEKVFQSATDEMMIIFRSRDYTSKGFTAKVWSDKTDPEQEKMKLYGKYTTPTSYTVTLPPTKKTNSPMPVYPKLTLPTTVIPVSHTTSTIITTLFASSGTSSAATTTPSTVLPFWMTTPTTVFTTTSTPPKTLPFWMTSPTVPGEVTQKPPDCQCSEWSEWTSSCTQQCGGCGKRSRRRWCSAKDCRTEDKRACNFKVCPPGTNFLINNGEFHLLWKGCCVGLFRAGKECSSLEDEQNPFLTILNAIFTPQDEKVNRTTLSLHSTKGLAH